jgi:hypothetical protein
MFVTSKAATVITDPAAIMKIKASAGHQLQKSHTDKSAGQYWRKSSTNKAHRPRIAVTSIRVHRKYDSAGRHVHEFTIITRQSRVEMWGKLTLYVRMVDSAGKVYFGVDSFAQPQRSSRTPTTDAEWVFHVRSDLLRGAKLAGVWAVYYNKADKSNFDDKQEGVQCKNINAWIQGNAPARKLQVKGERYRMLHW